MQAEKLVVAQRDQLVAAIGARRLPWPAQELAGRLYI